LSPRAIYIYLDRHKWEVDLVVGHRTEYTILIEESSTESINLFLTLLCQLRYGLVPRPLSGAETNPPKLLVLLKSYAEAGTLDGEHRKIYKGCC
jgi:hypothetical protein